MDWMKVKLTADDFEQGTIASSGAVGSAYNSLKLVNYANLRTKNLVPVSKVFYIPVKSGKSVYVAKPMLNLGDEVYPYSSAPEDESNPTEVS